MNYREFKRRRKKSVFRRVVLIIVLAIIGLLIAGFVRIFFTDKVQENPLRRHLMIWDIRISATGE